MEFQKKKLNHKNTAFVNHKFTIHKPKHTMIKGRQKKRLTTRGNILTKLTPKFATKKWQINEDEIQVKITNIGVFTCLHVERYVSAFYVCRMRVVGPMLQGKRRHKGTGHDSVLLLTCLKWQ